MKSLEITHKIINFWALIFFGVFSPRGHPLYGHLLGMELGCSPKSQGDGSIKKRDFIGLIVLKLFYWIFNSDNLLFPRENHLLFLVSSVTHIKDLGNLT